jgi:hypothetical protein
MPFTIDTARGLKRKQAFPVTNRKTVDVDKGTYEIWVSTETVDRSGDIVRAAGGHIDAYLKNPVVLWAHNHGLNMPAAPIAKTDELNLEAGIGWWARFTFRPFGDSELADDIHLAWRSNFVNAASIGFLPEKWINLNGAEPGSWEEWFSPKDMTEWEFIEWSLVPIGANSEALRRMVKHFLTTKERRRIQRRVTQRINRQDGERCETSELEAAFAIGALHQEVRKLLGQLRS